MSLQVEIIFSGLIALAFDEEILPHRQPEPKWERTSSLDAYLLADKDGLHVPELLIPVKQVKQRVGPKSCEGGHECARIDGGAYEAGSCSAPGFDHYVFCLAGYQIVLLQPSTATAEYLDGTRPEGGATRHLEYRTPGTMSDKLGGKQESYAQDITWVPEMTKVSGDVTTKLDLDTRVTSKLEGLRGSIVPLGVRERVWDWCDLSDDGCTQSTGRKYDQAFADGVAVSLGLAAPAVFLVPRSGDGDSFTIALAGPEKEPIRVFNLPKREHARLQAQPVESGSTWCIAKHFEHFFDILDSARVRVPYYVSKDGTCGESKSPITPSDSFCPPVIIKKP